MAKLMFFYGTMGSAKSLRLLTTAYNFEERNINFLVLKPKKDTRDGDSVVKSRIGLQRECVLIDDDTDVYSAIKEYTTFLNANLEKLGWVLIDECQFLTEEQVDQLSDVVDKLNVNVMCFGLKTDFQSKLFPASKRLFEIGDTFEEVKSSCSCGKKTHINARFDENGQIVLDGDQIMIGGNDIYKSMCRECWKKLISKIKK